MKKSSTATQQTNGAASPTQKAAYYESIMAAPTEMSIIIMDRDKNILGFNKGAENNYGFKAEEVVGQSFLKLNEDTPEQWALLDQLHDDCLKHGVANGRFTRRRKDGTTFQAQVYLARRDDPEGNSVGFLLSSRDLTEDDHLKAELEDVQAQLKADLLELSTPIMQVADRVLALPIIGTLDSGRTQLILENLLINIQEKEAAIIILDVSGVPAIDSIVGRNLLKTAKAAAIMGAQTIISGIRPETAQTIVEIGIDFESVRTRSKMADALTWAQSYLAAMDVRAAQ